ncbi:hypothetical protein HDU76_004550, partial [Blyttiomyces sp. JEL0837]
PVVETETASPIQPYPSDHTPAFFTLSPKQGRFIPNFSPTNSKLDLEHNLEEDDNDITPTIANISDDDETSQPFHQQPTPTHSVFEAAQIKEMLSILSTSVRRKRALTAILWFVLPSLAALCVVNFVQTNGNTTTGTSPSSGATAGAGTPSQPTKAVGTIIAIPTDLMVSLKYDLDIDEEAEVIQHETNHPEICDKDSMDNATTATDISVRSSGAMTTPSIPKTELVTVSAATTTRSPKKRCPIRTVQESLDLIITTPAIPPAMSVSSLHKNRALTSPVVPSSELTIRPTDTKEMTVSKWGWWQDCPSNNMAKSTSSPVGTDLTTSTPAMPPSLTPPPPPSDVSVFKRVAVTATTTPFHYRSKTRAWFNCSASRQYQADKAVISASTTTATGRTTGLTNARNASLFATAPVLTSLFDSLVNFYPSSAILPMLPLANIHVNSFNEGVQRLRMRSREMKSRFVKNVGVRVNASEIREMVEREVCRILEEVVGSNGNVSEVVRKVLDGSSEVIYGGVVAVRDVYDVVLKVVVEKGVEVWNWKKAYGYSAGSTCSSDADAKQQQRCEVKDWKERLAVKALAVREATHVALRRVVEGGLEVWEPLREGLVVRGDVARRAVCYYPFMFPSPIRFAICIM